MHIRFYTTNTELAQATQHFTDSFFCGQCPRCSFYKQGIIVWCNDSARESITAVQTNTETTRTTVRDQFTSVWHEMIVWIFCGNTTLDGHPFTTDMFLCRNCHCFTVQCMTFGNANLRMNNIDACDHFCHCMFYLDTRVDFNKIEVSIGGYQEFYCTSTDIIHVLHDFYSCSTNTVTQITR